MLEQNTFVVANYARIPCTVRTLKPFYLSGESKPWVHIDEILDAVLYLAKRIELPVDQTNALEELQGNLSYFIKNSSAIRDPVPESTAPINGL